MQRDPVKVHSNWMITQKLVDRAQLDKIDAEVSAEMEKAVQFAMDAPYPAPDKVDQDVYA